MRTRALFPVVVAALVAAAPVWADSATDRAEIVAGVNEIVAPGALPGAIVVFGENAFPVVTAREGKSRLPLFAAARFGSGRVVVGGHESFFGPNPAFTANVLKWAGRGPAATCGLNGTNAAAPIAVDGIAAFLSANPNGVLCLGQSTLDGARNAPLVESIRNWVRRGGGLVIAGPAWGWKQVTGGGDLLRDHSGNQLVLPMGIAFSEATLDPTTRTGGYAIDDVNLPLTHARTALDALATTTGDDQTQATQTLSATLGALPDSDRLFVPRVAALVAKNGGNTAIPSREAPIKTTQPYARLQAVLDAQAIRRGTFSGAHPSAASFPGAVPADAPRITRTVSVDGAVPEWHGTGLYAAPGEAITVTLPSSAVGKGLAVRIGAHRDTLWHLDKWERFPEVTLQRAFGRTEPKMTITSPFGGPIFVVVPENPRGIGSIDVKIENAVAAPRFVRGKTSVAEWKASIRSAPGPWAELEARGVILTVPSSAIRDLDDPEPLLAYWDEMMDHIYAFYAAPRRPRPERYCVDRQISAGYMHSGYPIMTGDDVAKRFVDVAVLRGDNGNLTWGFYHEMGHNFQRPEWTWDGCGEVTNNLFSLFGNEKLNRTYDAATRTYVNAHPAVRKPSLSANVAKYLAEGAPYEKWKSDPWLALSLFIELRNAFGWEPFTKVFASYDDPAAGPRPRTDIEKHDQFLLRFSKTVGKNVAPLFVAYGVPTTEEARRSLSGLPTWTPDLPKN